MSFDVFVAGRDPQPEEVPTEGTAPTTNEKE